MGDGHVRDYDSISGDCASHQVTIQAIEANAAEGQQ